MLTDTQKLKIKIMVDGIRIDDSVKEVLSKNGDFSAFKKHSTTSGIILILPDDIYVNARFADGATDSKIILKFDGKQYILDDENNLVFVKIVLPPDYINELDAEGNPYKEIIVTHADRMRVNPIIGCSFKCKYCDINNLKYKKIPLEKILNAINVAMEEKNTQPRHLLISGGTPKLEDTTYLDDIYKNVAECMKIKNVPVEIMLSPRKEKGFLKKLKQWGVDGMAINLEVYDKNLAKEVNPQKSAISREVYFDFIKEAVGVFGEGNIRSLLIVGLEPLESTLEGVEKLAQLGCDPVLSPFVPDSRTVLSCLKPPSMSDLEKIYLESKKVVEKQGVRLGPRCIPCQHNTLTFPDNSNDYFL